MVYVGKQAGLHTRTQEEIHALLCQFASEGSTVLRLKGGDPFIFGRGGEEAQYLQERGIAVYTVPGALPVHLPCCCIGCGHTCVMQNMRDFLELRRSGWPMAAHQVDHF